MNDRYLYRAKRKKWELFPEAQQWVQGYYVHTAESDYIVSPYEHTTLLGEGETIEIEVNTLCQCTGLKDKNGKLIWENDVVRCIDKNNDLEFIAVIEFGNPNAFYSWGYQLRHIKGDKPNLNILLWIDMEDTGAICEVISNTFDNPELLEVAE